MGATHRALRQRFTDLRRNYCCLERLPNAHLMLLPFQGATAPTRGGTQGVASLALGYVLHWAFSPHLLNHCCIFYARDREAMLGTIHSLIANCGVSVLQVRAESPMEHSAQGKRSDTLGIACWSSRALKGQKL